MEAGEEVIIAKAVVTEEEVASELEHNGVEDVAKLAVEAGEAIIAKAAVTEEEEEVASE